MTVARLDHFLGAEVIARLNAPVEQAEGLPAACYYDDAFYELERTRLFARGWMAVAFLNDVPEPGDVMPVRVADYELLVVRGQDGAVRVFYNVCRHRGMKLATDKCTKARAIVCPWHSWSYDLKGQLTATPHIGGLGKDTQSAIDRSALGLKEVRSASWLNHVFVDLSGVALPLEHHLAPLRARYAAYDFGALKPSDQRTAVSIDANWKIVIEGGVEDYHVPWVHPQLAPHPGTFKPEWAEGVYLGFSNTHPPERAYRRFGTGTGEGPAHLPYFPHLDTSKPAEGVLTLLFPNAYVSVHPTHAMTSIVVPEGPTRTTYRRNFLFMGDAATSPDYANLRDGTIATWMRVGGEDMPINAANQANLRTREAAGIATRYSAFWEPCVLEFQRMIARRMTA